MVPLHLYAYARCSLIRLPANCLKPSSRAMFQQLACRLMFDQERFGHSSLTFRKSCQHWFTTVSPFTLGENAIIPRRDVNREESGVIP